MNMKNCDIIFYTKPVFTNYLLTYIFYLMLDIFNKTLKNDNYKNIKKEDK